MIKLYNTLTRKKEEFKPLQDKKINIYLCGPTVYGPAHIGHARTYIAFDIIRRYLEYRGYKVTLVVNLTDIHDDIIKKANEQNTTIFKLADENIKLFMQDMHTLGIKDANHYPRVTKVIPEIIDFVKTLQEKGFAYETEDGVYYDISKFPDYGKLSRIKIDFSKTGTRVQTDKYDREKPMDFALWKKAKPGEPYWESQWGKGRPGWHIECSVMSIKHLGEQLDIHGGAVDLIFPHHENEIAQSEAATGKKPFVNYWLHTGFLNVSGEKMSKSLGNFLTIPELLEKYDPKVFRFFVAGLHYRSPIDFNENAMQQSKNSLEKIDNLIQNLQDVSSVKSNPKVNQLITETRKRFLDAMDDDFNSPNAFAAIFDFVRKLNHLIADQHIGSKDAQKAIALLKEFDSVFNIFTFEKQKLELPRELQDLIELREKYRKENKWAEADKIRKQLKENGILLDDTPNGVKWRKISQSVQ